MEVETRKPLIYNEAFLEHREQVIQRDRLAPPRVLPVHKSLPSIGIYFLSINCVILFYWGLFTFFSLIYIHSFSLSLFYLNNVVACHVNWRNSVSLVLCWVGSRSRKPFLYSMEELADMTDNFNEKNFIGETLFTKLYRGTIRQGWLPFEDWVVTVKIWDYTLPTSCHLDGIESFNVYMVFT